MLLTVLVMTVHIDQQEDRCVETETGGEGSEKGRRSLEGKMLETKK
jgi:hypothetical protein